MTIKSLKEMLNELDEKYNDHTIVFGEGKCVKDNGENYVLREDVPVNFNILTHPDAEAEKELWFGFISKDIEQEFIDSFGTEKFRIQRVEQIKKDE